MTENKRFLIDDAGELIDLNNHKFIDYGDECCKLLNELHDENEKLKIFLKAVNEELSLANRDNDTLEEEYEELKQHNTELINKIDFLEQVIDGDMEWLYVVVVFVNKVMVGVVGGISLQVEMCIVLIIKGNGSIRVGDVEWLMKGSDI